MVSDSGRKTKKNNNKKQKNKQTKKPGKNNMLQKDILCNIITIKESQDQQYESRINWNHTGCHHPVTSHYRNFTTKNKDINAALDILCGKD